MGTVAAVAAVLAATCSTPKVPTKSVVDWLIKNLGLAVAPGGPHGFVSVGPMNTLVTYVYHINPTVSQVK